MAKMTPQQALDLYRAAERAGLAAGAAKTPRPMVVGSPSTPFGNDVDPTKQTWYVPEGLCGFAWVVAKGTEPFIRALKKAGVEVSKAYPTGMYVKWVGEFGQSYERKQAYAAAFAQVLRENGVESAYSQSRLD